MPIKSHPTLALATYLRNHPGQAVAIEYDADGFSWALDDSRKWKATLKRPIGSKAGYITDTFENLINAIVTESA